MNWAERLKFAFGLLVALFGLIMLGGSVASEDMESGLLSELVLVLLFAVLPLTLGVWYAVRVVHKSKARRQDELENEILRLAARHSGRLTASEVAMNTRLSVTEAQKLLEGYVKNKLVTLKISGTGTLVFEFSDLIPEEEKREAARVADLL
ncbi:MULTISPECIES: hypothetical protein [unclassified Paenibacillus]|uniref:hypothetical protein n=1 Tax=unclassified Paenibacillus TaxID=185978 RepID=UPI001AE4E0E4|nr:MULTISPECIES: hypothetical protein [unclassified Paenibacillus]MBP1157232.1 hypothetical protein [Paenibacillus sp. PvP091]MBP1172029.1 hypothetical protein [Paenibacillus sp. PvR098]MBP2438410.1 hypothetical protein [Paenibacillus sp. PvP052]